MKRGSQWDYVPGKVNKRCARECRRGYYEECMDILECLMKHRHGGVFNQPVDPVELNIPDYFEYVKHPMDLGTIKMKLFNGEYRHHEDFAGDVTLTFENAMLYNPPENPVHKWANTMNKLFTRRWKKLTEKRSGSEEPPTQRRTGGVSTYEGMDHKDSGLSTWEPSVPSVGSSRGRGDPKAQTMRRKFPRLVAVCELD